ncbi:MAG TPA: hypothetical protein VFX97_00760 [Pyrinomonadaceae bacterium]|nr:hypothetical protein [Pyrinomonadaceae bacterium]
MFQGAEDSATKITVGWIAVIGAIGAALISLIGAVVNVIITRRSQKESVRLQREMKAVDALLAEKKQEFDVQIEVKRQSFQKELEAIRSGFEDENAEKRARRDYEYEARQRLYKEIEPLLFQLTEKGEDTLYRISGLAGESKNGNLTSSGGWLSVPDHYYTISNMYKFIAPLTFIKLMQRKLTAVDLSLVPQINALYTIARYLSWSFTDDFVVRNLANLPYEPNQPGWNKFRETNPSVYWRQGIPTGRLDKVVSLLINDTTGQCMSFGEFEDQWRRIGSPINETFEIVFDLFCDFHPKTRPILWRILIIQAHLYYALIRYRDQKPVIEESTKLVIPLRASQDLIRKNFDWRQANDQTTPDHEIFVQPFETAEIYLAERLKELFDGGSPSARATGLTR